MQLYRRELYLPPLKCVRGCVHTCVRAVRLYPFRGGSRQEEKRWISIQSSRRCAALRAGDASSCGDLRVHGDGEGSQLDGC